MEPFDSIVDRLVLNRGEPPKAEGPGLSGYAIAPALSKAKAKVDHADRTEPRQDTIHRIVSHQVLSDRSSPQQVRGPNSDTRQLDLRAGLAAVDVAVSPRPQHPPDDRRGPTVQVGPPDRTGNPGRRDLSRYALGGGVLGRVGVTPTELASHRPSTAGPRARLVGAITDFIADYLVAHSAALIRQGIIQR